MKRYLAVAGICAALAITAVAGATRIALHAVELNFDKRVQTLSTDIPFELLGSTRGVYLDGYGAVFTAEVNLSQSANISPFQQTIPKEYAAKLRLRKMDRVPLLKKSMQEEMLAMATSLDGVPPHEQIVLGVTLFYFKWENTSNLPSQIIMQAERQKLWDVQLGRASRTTLSSIIRAQEL